jgi:hypothetical protein
MDQHLRNAADVLLPVDAFQDAQLAERVHQLEPIAQVLVAHAARA